METAKLAGMRQVIVVTLGVCLAVASAPWLSGGQEPLALLLSAGALLLAAILVWRQPEARKLTAGPLVWSWWVLIAVAILSLSWTVNRYSTGLWVTEWVMAGLGFWLAYVLAGETDGRELMLRLYLISAGLFSVVAVAMFMTENYDRLTGPFYWSNPAAAYLIPAVVLAVDRVRRERSRKSWWWLAGAVGLLTTFLLTDSRAATIVLGIVLGVYCLISKAKRLFWIQFVFMILISVGLSIGLSWASTFTAHHGQKILPGSRFAEAAKGESQSLSDRLIYLESTARIWLDHPLGGTGAGTFADVHPRYQQRVVSASATAHNVYAQVLAELGLAGGLALLSVLVWLFAGTVKGLVANPEVVPVVLGLAGLLIHFGLDIDATYPALLMLVAVLAGLSFRQWNVARGRPSWRAAVVAAMLLVPAASLYRSDTWAQAASSYQDDGDFSGAALRYETAHSGLIYNPDLVNAEGINWYSLAATGGKDAPANDARALALAKAAEHSDPDDAQHHQLEGRVLALKGDLKGAEAALRAALRLDPYNHPQYALDLAGVQLAEGNADGAVDTASAMLNQYPDEVVANREVDPTLKPVLANLEALVGNVYLKQDNRGDAQYAATRALKLDPTNVRGRALQHQLDHHGGN
jgi:O-antigen ligase